MRRLKMHAILLGAGFSKWAADLPLASQLFDFDIEPFGVREQNKLDRIISLKHQWDCTNIDGLAEQFISYVLACGDERSKKDILWYIVRRLSAPYIWYDNYPSRIRRHVLMIDEYRKWDLPGVRLASDFIMQCGKGLSGIITLNYDLLLEYGLGSHAFNYGIFGEVLHGRGPYPVSQWRSPVTLTGQIPLVKLHGSISWDIDGRYTDGRRGLSGKALIVAPSPEKIPPSFLVDQWYLSQQILQKVSRLLVFGFGFNEYDQAVLLHLQESGSHLEEVAIIDVVSRKLEAQCLWPKAEIETFSPPTDRFENIKVWLRNGY